MTSGFNFWDGEIWSFIVTLALLFGGMLLANLLRIGIAANIEQGKVELVVIRQLVAQSL